MSEKKKFWIFYLVYDKAIWDVEPYGIYAYTNKKEYAKKFENTRNMNRFCMKELKLDREEINALYKNFTNNQLEIMKGKTKLNDTKEIREFETVVTMREQIACKHHATLYINEYACRYAWDTPYIFKSKYIRALNTIGYSYYYNYIRGTEEMLVPIYKNIEPDMLSILLDLYKELFED